MKNPSKPVHFILFAIFVSALLAPSSLAQKRKASTKSTSPAPVQTNVKSTTDHPGLWPVKDGDKWGYIDRNGKMVVALQFDVAAPFREGLAMVVHSDKVGFIDKTGRYAIEPQFQRGDPKGEMLAYFFSEGLAPVQQNRSCGYIDKKGTFLIPPVFDRCSPFSENLASVDSRGKVGFIGSNGKYAIKPQFRAGGPFVDGVATVLTDDFRWGVIDRTGRFTISPRYEDVGGGLPDMLDPGYFKFFGFSSGLISVREGGKWEWGYVGKDGRLSINRQAGEATPFSEGLAGFYQPSVGNSRRKCGYLDTEGKYAIAPVFSGCGPFSEGLAFVSANTTAYDKPADLGIIDKNGNFIAKFRLTRLKVAMMGLFTNGIASFGTFAVDRSGRVIWQRTRASSVGAPDADLEVTPVR